jgi:hypothetical protein
LRRAADQKGAENVLQIVRNLNTVVASFSAMFLLPPQIIIKSCVGIALLALKHNLNVESGVWYGIYGDGPFNVCACLN